MPRAFHAALIVLPFTACSETLGIELFPRAAFLDANCGECIDGECASEADACAADPACANLYACVAGCASSDVYCRGRCEGQYAGAKQGPGWQAYESCQRDRCATSCVAPLFADAACASCVEDSCSTERDTCAADADCAPLFVCMAGCPVDDWLCRFHCEELHPAGVKGAAFEGFDRCRRSETGCIDTCIGTTLPLAGPKPGPGCAECLATSDAVEIATRECLTNSQAVVSVADCERNTVCESDWDDPSDGLRCDRLVYPYPVFVENTVHELWDAVWAACYQQCWGEGEWDCVGSWSLDVLDPIEDANPVADVTVYSGFDGNPIAGALIDRCTWFIPAGSDCNRLDSGFTTGANGNVILPTFDGYFRFRVGPPGQEFIQYNYYWPPMFFSQYYDELVFSSLDELQQNVQHFDPEWLPKPGLGHIGIGVRNCWSAQAAGVFWDVDDDGKGRETSVLYTFSTPEDGTQAGVPAQGGIGNVNPGERTVVAKLKDGTEVARATVYVGPDAFTSVTLFPNRK